MDVTRFLRVEGLAVALAAGLAFVAVDGSWLVFALLVLAPDLSMLGYLRGPRLGAWTYNLAHVYVGPLALFAAGLWWGEALAVEGGLVWLVHVGVDRLAGYGLKEPTGFGDTHLGRVGRSAAGRPD